MAIDDISQENFHKICVVGGGITGAIMVLLLKKSKMFKLNDIGWVKPSLKLSIVLQRQIHRLGGLSG